MLKGDLTSTPLAPLLISLADEEATGCLHISDAEGDEALIFFKTGLVYAVTVPGRRPQLGAKLVSSGALAPEALAEALEAQRTELQGWKLGELLVHLGYVDQPVVEAFVKEQVHDAIWDLIRWTEGRWRFRRNEKTREDVAPPMPVTELLTTLRERGVEWEAISAIVHGPTAVPVLSARGGGEAETTLDADAWSMLCKIDGERSVAELARDCGYTMFEAGQVLVSLVQAGLADIEEDIEVTPAVVAPPEAEPVDSLYGATTVSSALAADAGASQPDDEFAALARLVSEVAAGVREEDVPVVESFEDTPPDVAAVAALADVPSQAPLRPDAQSFSASVERVSAALADVLGPPPETADPFEVPAELRMRRTPKKKEPAPTPIDPRRARIRAAAAEELAAAHALAEALREEAEASSSARSAGAEVVDLDQVRREAAEQEAARVAAEEAEAARVAAEEEAARLAAEQEAARIAAEEAEAARIAAEEEAARVAAEEEAARVAAEAARVAAEEAARVAAEEEAARIAAEEEAARIAAEEAEAARVAAEEAEAARIAAEEAEAARVAAEEAEAARVAAEEAEAARIAAEEAARGAAEEAEAARVAAEEEAAQLAAAELADAEIEAWAEYWTREAESAAEDAAAEETAAADDDLTPTVAPEVELPDLVPSAADPRFEANAMLAELAQQVSTEPELADEELADEVEDDEPYDEDPVPAFVGAPLAEMTDTAALLRELSSLGIEDEPATPPPPPRLPSRPPAGAGADKKKKRGLFGR